MLLFGCCYDMTSHTLLGLTVSVEVQALQSIMFSAVIFELNKCESAFVGMYKKKLWPLLVCAS